MNPQKQARGNDAIDEEYQTLFAMLREMGPTAWTRQGKSLIIIPVWVGLTVSLKQQLLHPSQWLTVTSTQGFAGLRRFRIRNLVRDLVFGPPGRKALVPLHML